MGDGCRFQPLIFQGVTLGWVGLSENIGLRKMVGNKWQHISQIQQKVNNHNIFTHPGNEDQYTISISSSNKKYVQISDPIVDFNATDSSKTDIVFNREFVKVEKSALPSNMNVAGAVINAFTSQVVFL